MSQTPKKAFESHAMNFELKSHHVMTWLVVRVNFLNIVILPITRQKENLCCKINVETLIESCNLSQCEITREIIKDKKNLHDSNGVLVLHSRRESAVNNPL